MLARHQHGTPRIASTHFGLLAVLSVVVLVGRFIASASAHNPNARRLLRLQTEELFYHGFENYMKHAFPEDELRPLSCVPLTRDRDDPGHVEINDALGNYSLTAIDTLSTLAVLASTPSDPGSNKPLLLFQNTISDLVTQYGDGTQGSRGKGLRARGFDVDSKVQVFETVIRGLGGLLSAHLFAVGDLPITGYSPPHAEAEYARLWNKTTSYGQVSGIRWSGGFVYDGQLLRLAHDLGRRLIPAFWTSTGIPYPRVNLRSGIPFYANSANNYDPTEGQCDTDRAGTQEVTETCSAGAGSLLLEFTVLSRLTGDPRFEDLGKRAFWAIWNRRSTINLIGSGIDAETGEWVHSSTGIGAGVDSFFEYAFKAYVLLSADVHPAYTSFEPDRDPRVLFEPLNADHHAPASFLQAWEEAHAAINRHLLRKHNFQHAHYIQGDMTTGAARAFWVDALSAYYPGLLAMSGFIDEAIESHLLTTALWSRFSALPERYNLLHGGIEGGLGWWVGRPEFIESNYYLYRATEDPWYHYVAEMTLRDIRRRCRTECGWAGIQDVLTGEKNDRMESFFLGETAKYLYLTFDQEHPLNHFDGAFVFSTEGHPLIIPRSVGDSNTRYADLRSPVDDPICPVKPSILPLSISATAARPDVYHAASLARLHWKNARNETANEALIRTNEQGLDNIVEGRNPSSATHYPWTLPLHFVPFNATSSQLPSSPTFEISIPAIQNSGLSQPPLQRVREGILINHLGGLKLGLVQDWLIEGGDYEGAYEADYRIHSINNIGLGRDEKIFMSRDIHYGNIDPTDPIFSKVQDLNMIDLVVDPAMAIVPNSDTNRSNLIAGDKDEELVDHEDDSGSSIRSAWEAIVSSFSSLMQESEHLPTQFHATIPLPDGMQALLQQPRRRFIPAILPAGVGVAPLPDCVEATQAMASNGANEPLDWTKVFAAGDLCETQLAQSVPLRHHIVLVKRGGCSFSRKLSNIPAFAPSRKSLQLVVVVSDEGEDEDENDLTCPLLEETQMTNNGFPRPNALPMVMVGGGDSVYQTLKIAKGIGIRRRYSMQSQGRTIGNLFVV